MMKMMTEHYTEIIWQVKGKDSYTQNIQSPNERVGTSSSSLFH